jgi:pilus assembly protein Flp/PilA
MEFRALLAWHMGCSLTRRRATARASQHAAPKRRGFASFTAMREEEVMVWLMTKLRSLVRDTEGQDLLEYALLVALIAIIAIAAVTAAGGTVKGIFTQIAADI